MGFGFGFGSSTSSPAKKNLKLVWGLGFPPPPSPLFLSPLPISGGSVSCCFCCHFSKIFGRGLSLGRGSNPPQPIGGILSVSQSCVPSEGLPSTTIRVEAGPRGSFVKPLCVRLNTDNDFDGCENDGVLKSDRNLRRHQNL